jgi:hypothetical protein
MLNYYTTQNCLVRNVSRMVYAAVLLLMAITFANAQTCPPAITGGSTQLFELTSSPPSSLTRTYYPSALPPGASGESHSTAGRIYTEDAPENAMNVSHPLRTVTINPQFTDGTVGFVVLRFDALGMAAPAAVIKIYQGTAATGSPVETITSSNASTYLLTTRQYTGPVTVTFESPTPAASGNFDIRITYSTGNKVATSAFGFPVAYWTNLISPNQYAAFESYPNRAVPEILAYFDASKQFVSSEISFCIDYGKGNNSVGNSVYPGEGVFVPEVQPDLNQSGTVDNADKLLAARLIYVLTNGPTPLTTEANFDIVQSAVDGLSRGNGFNSLATAAINNITSVPTEPVFSITGPGSAAPASAAQNFTVNLTNDSGHPRVFKLVLPAGVTLNSVTGATYNAGDGTITFGAAQTSATVSVTSATSQTASLRVVYEQPGFWNVNNLTVYRSCYDPTMQRFLGLSKTATPYPYREASGTWSAALDYGDLPNGYATSSASNGPSHAITAYNATTHTSSLMLGSQIDAEADGVAGAVADGDNIAGVNDEDAITQFPTLAIGQTTYSVTVPVTNTTGATATVKGWIDFNRNGSFGAGEEATQTVADGATSVTLTWPSFTAAATAGEVYARFRIATVASEIATPTGAANSGEVEDYRLFIGVTVAGTVFHDMDYDRIIDSGENFTGLPAPMYVYMVYNNVIVDAATVAANGTYLLTAPANGTSTVHQSGLQYPIGTNTSTTPIDHTPPTGWKRTGENSGGNNNNTNPDNNADGILSVTVTNVNLVNRNFGLIEKAGISGAYDVCASDRSELPLADFIFGQDLGGTWSYVSGSGITFNAAAGTIQLTSSATTSTYRYDVGGSFSIATVRVRQLPVKTQSITICQGQSYCLTNPVGTARVIAPDETYCHTTSGVYTDTLSMAGQYGCDSIVVTTLTVIPTPNAGADGNTTVCSNSTTPIELFNLITGEQTGGVWARTSGTGGTFNAGAGTFTPAAGATNSTFSYTVTGANSCGSDVSVATVTLNNCSVLIAGSVWNDGNGNAVKNAGESPVSGNNTNNGGTSVPTGGNVYANLVDGSGAVLQSVQVNPDGTFAFAGVAENLPYKVILTTTSQSSGTILTAGSGPATWLPTGTSLNGVPSAGNTTYVIDLGTVTANVSNADFGIQRQPVADAKTFVVANTAFSPTPSSPFPVVTGYQAIPASSSSLTGYPTGGSLSGSDAEDCAAAGTCNTGTGTTFTIETINSNTKLYYNFGSGPVEINGNTVIPNFNVNNLVIYGQNGGGTTGNEFGFEYTITDKAGVKSAPVVYEIQTQSALPVTLISFDVVAEGKTANLKWATSSEANSKGFEVERSVETGSWTTIGYVASQNSNSSSQLTYNFSDASPARGINYYRLKMIDLDGTSAYSRIRSLKVDKAAMSLVAYPNPVVNGKLTIDVSGSGSYQADVYSLSGVLVLQHNLGASRELNVSNLTSGMYLLRVKSADGEVKTKTFVVK